MGLKHAAALKKHTFSLFFWLGGGVVIQAYVCVCVWGVLKQAAAFEKN